MRLTEREITIGPADGWKIVTAAGHEVMVTGESAVAVEVWWFRGSWIMIGASPYSDGERWTWNRPVAPGDEFRVREAHGTVIRVRRR